MVKQLWQNVNTTVGEPEWKIYEWILWTFSQKNVFKKEIYFYFQSFFIALLYQFSFPIFTSLFFQMNSTIILWSFHPRSHWYFGTRYEPAHWLGNLDLDQNINVFLPGIKHLLVYLFETCAACLSKVLQFSSH